MAKAKNSGAKQGAETCPSPEYLEYVRTSGGLVPTDPTGFVASEFDYADWYSLIQSKLLVNMEWQWARFGDVSKAPHDEWNVLVPEVNTIRQEANDLVKPWDFTSITSANEQVTQAVELAIRIACLWEQIAHATKAAGGKTRKPPETGEKTSSGGLGLLGTVGLVTMIGVGATAIVMISRRSNRKEATA